VPRTLTLNKDIARAKLTKVDAEGRSLDFHSFRYFFCTLLAKKPSIQVVRMLMHHRDIRQTGNLYMDLGLTDVTEAVLELPRLIQPQPTPPAETAPLDPSKDRK
jgi:integrase